VYLHIIINKYLKERKKEGKKERRKERKKENTKCHQSQRTRLARTEST
jgi:hypothetical protein